MMEKIYLNLLLFFGILFQGIIGTLTDDDVGESSDTLVRQKRVISYADGEDKRAIIRNSPYVVVVKQNNRIICVGSILSQRVVITIPQCVSLPPSHHHILSGTSRTDRGISHNVTDIKTHYGRHPQRHTDGIALVTVEPAFVYGSNCLLIRLHSGSLTPGTFGMVSGWGFNWRSETNRGTRYPEVLRSIIVPIISHQDCINRYLPHNTEIFSDHICTYDPHRHSGHNDGGAPLVVNDELVGVHIWTGPDKTQNDPRYPDVFALLQHYEYNQWIRTTVRNIEAQFGNHVK